MTNYNSLQSQCFSTMSQRAKKTYPTNPSILYGKSQAHYSHFWQWSEEEQSFLVVTLSEHQYLTAVYDVPTTQRQTTIAVKVATFLNSRWLIHQLVVYLHSYYVSKY